MANDDFQKVARGQKLRIPANTWNTLLDSALEFRRRKLASDAGAGGGPFGFPWMVRVKNSSGSDCERFHVLGINAPIITPSDDSDQFQNEVTLDGITPTTASHTGKFFICAEPITNGSVGYGLACGVFPAQIDVTDAAHDTADVKDSDRTKLASQAGTGLARILWKESGTGTKWGIVLMSGVGSAPATFPVQVQKDGGADGDATMAATWTYTVRDLNGNVLGTTVDQSRPRPKGMMIYQTGSAGYGLAFYDGSTLILWDAGEVPSTGDCSS